MGLKWRRQQVILGYIVDFYCAELRLALELDGARHWEPSQMAWDARRDAALARHKVEVVRIRNEDATLEGLVAVLSPYVRRRQWP